MLRSRGIVVQRIVHLSVQFDRFAVHERSCLVSMSTTQSLLLSPPVANVATAEKNEALSAGTPSRIRPSNSASMPRPVVKDVDLECGSVNETVIGRNVGPLRGTQIRLRGSIASKPV